MDIDFVIMWVDGSDQKWLEEKRKYEPEAQSGHDNTKSRFRDWGILEYWFRSVEKYAPWVRKVHFVTYGHLPPFLNTSYEKLHIVNHKDYMPKEALPTYNSCALEMNLWRIDDLAEHFVYFNDDMFLCRPVKKSDFFDEKSGLPCLSYEEVPVRYYGSAQPWQIQCAADIAVINKHIKKRAVPLAKYPGKFISTKAPMRSNVRSFAMKILFPEYYTGFKNHHSYSPFRKSLCQEIWEKEPEVMKEVTVHKFRKDKDVNQWLYLWWQLASGQFVPKNDSSRYFEANEDSIDEICKTLREGKAEGICINDPDDLDDYEALKEKLQEAFLSILPEKSKFEKEQL